MLLFNFESVAIALKTPNAAVNFDTYRNLQRQRAVLPAIARHLVKVGPDRYRRVIRGGV